MSIDRDINSRVDAYRGNPQALQQKYQQDKQLLDLLALQKLKSDKEAVANQMAMQMQDTPDTIKQQREKELMEMTQAEVTKNVGGALQKKEADRKKRMMQMGIAAAPAPNMANMPKYAGGGIVAFEKGGDVNVEEFRKRFPGRTKGLSDEEVAKMIRSATGIGLETRDTMKRAVVDPAVQGLEAFGKDVSRAAKGPVDFLSAFFAGDRSAAQPNPQQSAEMPPPDKLQLKDVPDVPDEEARPPLLSAGDSSYVSQSGPGVGERPTREEYVDTTPYEGDTAAQDSLTSFARGNLSTPDYRESAKTATGILGIDQADAEYKDMIQQAQARLDEITNPKRNRREQLASFLRGMANTGGLGSTMASASGAAAKTRAQQEAAEAKGIQGIMDLRKEGLSTQLRSRELALDTANKRESYANQRQQSAVTAMKVAMGDRFSAAEQERAVNEAKNVHQRQVYMAELDAYGRQLVANASNNLRKMAQSAQNEARLLAAKSEAQELMEDYNAKSRDPLANPAMREYQEAVKDGDEDRANKILQKIDTERRRVMNEYQATVDLVNERLGMRPKNTEPFSSGTSITRE